MSASCPLARAVRWLRPPAVAALAALGAGSGCSVGGPPPEVPVGTVVPTSSRPSPPEPPGPLSAAAAENWHFVEVTRAAGLDYTTGYTPTATTLQSSFATHAMNFAGGVASGDYDGDGLPDLFAVRGDIGANLLFHNQGDGTFTEVGAAAGVAFPGARFTGPIFADLDGDGHLDLFLGGIEDTTARVLRNRGDGTFEDRSADSGLAGERMVVSAAFGDYDQDGDLDLLVGRWGCGVACEHLFRNDGNFHFTPVGRRLGVDGFGSGFQNHFDFTFTPGFADLDDDGWPDLLLASDFLSTQYFMSQAGRSFAAQRADVARERNGMGGTIGDYDGDGRLDWFVTGIYDPEQIYPPPVGNRLFRNLGGGHFEDTTVAAGVANGWWGWGTCFADLNNDGALDLFQTNGFRGSSPLAQEADRKYMTDPARLFVNNGDGTFSQRAEALGVADTGQGRGVVCFDYDGDGDLDLFVANSDQPPLLYRNEAGAASHSLSVRLRAPAPNSEAIGARVFATVGGRSQVRELRAGSNYASQDPAVAHFGIGSARSVDRLRILWPDRSETVREDVPAGALLLVEHP